MSLRHRANVSAKAVAGAPVELEEADKLPRVPLGVVVPPAAETDWLERNHKVVPYFVAAIAAFTRFYRIDQPQGVVFDETHFGKFTNWTTSGAYYFDIHPPLGKLTFWLVGRLTGYVDSACEYEGISEMYSNECKYYVLRGTSAAFSVGTVTLMYLISRNWGASVRGAILAACLVAFDMLNLIEGRLILIDSQLMFWLVASLYAAQSWWIRLNLDTDAANEASARAAAGEPPSTKPDPRVLTQRERSGWAVAVGVVCANAFSIKMTGLATPGIIGVESFLGIWFLKRTVPLADCLTVLITGILTYALWFRCHFALLTNSGPGDEFMTPRYLSTLKNSTNYDPKATWEGFWTTLYTLNRRMIVHNAAIVEPHPWQSAWWEWIADLRGVLYYSKDAGHTYTSSVYLIGNASVLWSVAAGWVVFALLGALYLRYRGTPGLAGPLAKFAPYFAQVSFCLTVYIINLAPYLGVIRSTFLYHYMPALVYAELATARTVEVLAGRKWMPFATILYLIPVVGTYLFFSPWIYALPITSEGHQRRRWMPRWN